MFAEVMGEEAYCAYRIHLEIFLQIPTDASDQNIHQLIEAGFSASSVMALYALGTIPLLNTTRSFRSKPSNQDCCTVSG